MNTPIPAEALAEAYGARSPKVAERHLQRAVIHYAKITGWKCFFTWNSKHSPADELDLRMVRPPRVVFAELKREDGKLTDGQEDTVRLLSECPGVEVYVWRPSDWKEIEGVLKR